MTSNPFHDDKKVQTLKKKKQKKKTKKGGGKILDSISASVGGFTAYPAKRLFRWLFRERANIFDVDVFIHHKSIYLRTLFIYLRYRARIDEKTLTEAMQFWKSKKRGTKGANEAGKINEKSFSNKNTLKGALSDLYDAVHESVTYSGLSITNKVCYKNCLCIAIMDTLRHLNQIEKAKELSHVIETITQIIRNSAREIVQSEQNFENRFRIKFKDYEKINFRVMNVYDYGFTFNLFYYGPFYHSKLHTYDIKGGAGEEIEKVKKERDVKFKRLLKDYATYVLPNKAHILPKPTDRKPTLMTESEKVDAVNKIIKVDQKRKKREFTLNGTDPDDVKAMHFLNGYLEDIANVEQMSYDIYSMGNDIDVIDGRPTLDLKFKNRIVHILKEYTDETSGLVRAQNVSRELLVNSNGFHERFLSQMEVVNNECEFIHFELPKT